jgi:hypothetical protein
MQIDLDMLLTQLSSADINERIAGVHLLQEDVSFEKPDLTPEIIQALNRIVLFDNNAIVRKEAERLLERDEYLDLYKRLGITLPTALSQASVEIPKPTSTSMKNNSSGKLYIVGRIFLGLIIAIFVFVLIEIIFRDYLSTHPVQMFDAYPILAFYIMLISIIILVSAFALVKKYPILIGVILLALGVISIILLYNYPPLEIGGNDISTLFICIPWYLVIMLFGFLFLRFGLIDKGKSRIK